MKLEFNPRYFSSDLQEDYKYICRKFTHTLVEKQKKAANNKWVFDSKVAKKANAYVDDYFIRHPTFVRK